MLTAEEARNRQERRAIAAGHDSRSEPAAWRINDWRRQVPMSRTTFYQQVKAGRIRLVKLGSASLVTTAPREFVASLQAA